MSQVFHSLKRRLALALVLAALALPLVAPAHTAQAASSGITVSWNSGKASFVEPCASWNSGQPR